MKHPKHLSEQKQSIPNELPEHYKNTLKSEERITVNCGLAIMAGHFIIRLALDTTYLLRSAKRYIESLCGVEGSLYNLFDLEPIYFSLLDEAVQTLLQNQSNSAEDRASLIDSLYRAAVIFQTAADKTQQAPVYAEAWAAKSQEYRELAERLEGKGISPNHFAKMEQLYLLFAGQDKRVFIAGPLLEGASRMHKKQLGQPIPEQPTPYKRQQASTSSGMFPPEKKQQAKEETQPLLASKQHST
ncbi:MAG: hypothetical protein PHZ25_03525 [Candidatus Pacebacteria bacterium]|nr:hypothetical protein [Candidatus Paceibacterota bacterium]